MGLEFTGLFNHWADSYDDTVAGHDPEYQDVFRGYDDILNHVVHETISPVLEFGTGTGNLTQKLLTNGFKVYGIEPSQAMRRKTKEKLPNLKLSKGDFLTFDNPERPIQSIVSSYAFHHLTDDEKDLAIEQYCEHLPQGGKIVFADTLFANQQSRERLLQETKQKGFTNLLHDLQTEYYTFKDNLASIFAKHGFDVEFKQLNAFVWLITAVKL
ncbi:class I SAM-dependent methyltransferase [Tuberibacillus sp. Marseille-P3662]|uniref:class I SAM-dependent methyltransferase n=1 Tax=Tuberibacillus sp. Marseille-P3662 TaxID=1965358 RepID=UPI000A1CD847|nr:class I SAM-dependent methyltransferase [Tuberibacillus sp. Marseille-P3662]